MGWLTLRELPRREAHIPSGDDAGGGRVYCPGGKKALGGGVSVDNGQVYVSRARPPTVRPVGTFGCTTLAPSQTRAYAWVICANVAS